MRCRTLPGLQKLRWLGAFLFGYAICLDIRHAPIALIQESRIGCADELAAHFAAAQAFRVVLRSSDRREAAEALQSGTIWAALVIPADFACDPRHGNNTVQWLLDGVEANSARLLRHYALLLLEAHALELGHKPLLRIEDRTWFNETKESRFAIIPGVIAIVMAVIGALITSLAVAREAETGSLVMLRTTPLTRSEFLLGKLIPYFCIGMVDMALAVVVAVFIFSMPLHGSLLSLTLLSALFLSVVMLQGTLISILAGNQLLASQVAIVSTFLPAFLLSGFIFAIDNMPLALRYLTLAVPARYYVTLSKAIFLQGITPLLLWTEVAALLTILLLLLGITLRLARRLGLA